MANISDEEMEGLDVSMDMGMSPPRAGPSSRYCPPGTSYGSPVASSSTYPDSTRRERYKHLNLMNNLAKMQKLKRIRRQLELNRTPPPMESPPTSPLRTPGGAAPCPMSPLPSPFQSPQVPWSPRTPPRPTPCSPGTPRTPRTPQSPLIRGRNASSPCRAMPEGWVPLFADEVELPDDLLDPVEFLQQREEPLDLLIDEIPAALPQPLIVAPLRKGFFNMFINAEPSAEPGVNLTNETMGFDSIEQISYEDELEQMIREDAAQEPLVDPYFPDEPCEGQAEYEMEKKWLEFEENQPLDMSASFAEAPSYISIPSTKDTTRSSTRNSTIPSFLHSTYSSMGSDAELFIENEGAPGTYAMPAVCKIKDPGARFQRLKFLKDMHFRNMTEESFSSSLHEDFFIPPVQPALPERRHSLYNEPWPRDSIRNQVRRRSAPPRLFEEKPRSIYTGELDDEFMDWNVSGASSIEPGEPAMTELFEEDEPGHFTMPYISMIQDAGARFQRLKLLKDMHREKSKRRDRVMPPMGRVPERRHSLDQRSTRNQVRRGSAPPGLLDNKGPFKMLFPRRHSLSNEQRPRDAARSQVRRGSAPADFYDKRFSLPVIIDRRHSFSDEQRPRDSIGNHVRRGSAPPDLFERLPPPPPLIFPGDIGDEEIEWDSLCLMPDDQFETTPREYITGVIEPEDVYSPEEEIAFCEAARRFIEVKHNPQMYYESHRPTMPPLPTAQELDNSGFSDLAVAFLGDECLDSFSSVGSTKDLFVEDENILGAYTMPGISNIQDPARRFEKLRQLRSSHFGEVPADHFTQFVQNAQILDRRQSFGGRNQAREVFPGRLSGPPGMLEVLPSAPPLIRPGNILDESMDFGDVSETSTLPSEPDESNLFEESFDLDETIRDPVVYEFPDIVEPEDAYSPQEEQAIRDAQRRFLEVKYNPEMYYPSQAFAHIPQRDRLFDESFPYESFEDWEIMGAPPAAMLDDDEMSLINAIPATPQRRPRRLLRGMSPNRRASPEGRLSGPPIFNLEMERRSIPDRIPDRVVGRVFDAPDLLEGQPCPGELADEAFDLILDDSGLSGIENITKAPVTRGRHSFGLTPTKKRHRRRLSGPPDFNVEKRGREQSGFIDTSLPEHDYSGVSDFFPPTTAQWAEEMFRTIGKPGRRASYGGVLDPQVCPGRRMSAPPEPIGPIDYFEMDPRKPETRPRHSLGMTPTRPRAGRRLSVPPKLDICGRKEMFRTIAAPPRRRSFGGATGQQKHYPGRRMSGPPNMQNLVDPGICEFDPRGPDRGGRSGMPRSRPDRRASYGGVKNKRQVCPERRLSAPPEPVGQMDYFEMDPRRAFTGPRQSLGMTPTRPREGRRLSAPPGLTFDQEGSLERIATVSFIDITKPDGGEQHISILSKGTRSPKEVHFSPSRDSPDRSLIEDVSFSFEDIDGLYLSSELEEDFEDVQELRNIISAITSTPKMKRRRPIIPQTLPKMSPIQETNMRMYRLTPSPKLSPRYDSSDDNLERLERIYELAVQKQSSRSPTPPRTDARRRLSLSKSPSKSPSSQRPHPSEMSALERMLEGIDDDLEAPCKPAPSQVYASFFAKPAPAATPAPPPTPRQVYASFAARASPAVCPPTPQAAGLRQPLARSPPAPIQRTQVLRTPNSGMRRPSQSGMRVPATTCMPTPANSGTRAPAATGMRIPAATCPRVPAITLTRTPSPTCIPTPPSSGMQAPAATAMRAPAATGMRTPAATGLRTPGVRAPSAIGVRTPAASAMRTPSQTSIQSVSGTVIRTPAAAVGQGSSGTRTLAAPGTRVPVVTQRISTVANARPSTSSASSGLRTPASKPRASTSGLRAPTRSSSSTAIPPTGCISRLKKPTNK